MRDVEETRCFSPNSGKTVLIHGKQFTASLCYRQALTLYQSDPAVWIGLGRSLASWEGVTLNGRSYNKIQCFEEALRLDPKSAAAWCQLGVLLCDSNQRSTAEQCAGMSGFQCLVQGLSLHPFEAEYWVCVGNAFPPDRESIVVPVDGTSSEFSRRDCFLEALRRNPKSAPAWAGLGSTLETAKSTIAFPDGCKLTTIDCCVEALRLDREYSWAWSTLADWLDDDEDVIVIPGDPPRGKQYCLSEALRSPQGLTSAPAESFATLQEDEQYKCLTVETASVHDQSVRSMRFGSFVGKGANGAVWSVRGRQNVVVKIRSVAEDSPERRMQQADILEELRGCPGVVQTEKVLLDRRQLKQVVLMERMKGSLAGPLLPTSEGPKLPLCECLRVCTNLLEALGYMHSIGITHGDIKPENILYRILPSGERQYKLADFDGAMKRGEIESGPGQGTPLYCSPERANGETGKDGSGACWDIWALGVTLYVLRYGKYPWASPINLHARIKAHGSDFTHSGFFPTVPAIEPDPSGSPDTFSEADFQSLVRQMLSIDVAARPSAEDLFALLPLERLDSSRILDEAAEDMPGVGEGVTVYGIESLKPNKDSSSDGQGEGSDSRVSTEDHGLSSDGLGAESTGTW